jgi:hypothetical protein
LRVVVVRKRLAGAVLGGTRLVEELAPQRVMTVVQPHERLLAAAADSRPRRPCGRLMAVSAGVVLVGSVVSRPVGNRAAVGC